MNIRKVLDIAEDEKIIVRKPDHGPCCCCQTCGYDHDYCRCWENRAVEVAEYVEQQAEQIAELVEEGNYLREEQAHLLNENQRLKAQIEEIKESLPDQRCQINEACRRGRRRARTDRPRDHLRMPRRGSSTTGRAPNQRRQTHAPR